VRKREEEREVLDDAFMIGSSFFWYSRTTYYENPLGKIRTVKGELR